ncbi:right-handed parallel beta-helix repeat-containing protein [Spirosoma soli]|uniref:Right-handed parallel beta-helix repeat-containing protein n=1 Tax=Spirosoma soli TaxID=1770529 RepID=A0ABW5MAZ6_9BACT
MNKILSVLFLVALFALTQCKKTNDVDPDQTTPPGDTTSTGASYACNEPNPTPRTWYVALNGSDTNDGTVDKPLKTVQKAVDSAKPGDAVELRAGTHESREIKIRTCNLTLRSYPGEWAVIKAVTNVEDITSVLWYREPTIVGGLIENLEIVGGYLYGIKLENNWENSEPVRRSVSDLTIRNCRIHDTGRDCLKIVPGCLNIKVLNCEIYRSGIGPANVTAQNAEGIDNVNGSGMVVRNCYIHDIATTGLYAKGGAKNCIIENNLIVNCGDMGVTAGNTDTDEEWFDNDNRDYAESFDMIIRNNIIVGAKWGGVGLFAAVRPQVVNNTFVNVASDTYGALYISRGETYVSPNGALRTPPCRDVTVLNNIFVQAQTGDRPMIRIRYNDDDKAESLTGTNQIDYNRYFRPGKVATYENRQKTDLTFAQWKAATKFDVHSYEGDPKLNVSYHLQSGSSCVKAGLSQSIVTIDYDGNPRSGNPDIGADEAGGAVLAVPPPATVIGTGLN